MNSWLIISILALYILMLFACAMFGEKYTRKLPAKLRLILFSLTLGVYCSSWTFYGASASLTNNGILALSIYIGPLLFIALGYDIWRRLGRVRQYHAISSIADFVASRYGKSGVLASIVTILAIIAIVPYLALQLRAIALSTNMILQNAPHLYQAQSNDAVMFLTAILAVLAMIFGTRQIANTEQHGGLMLAVAFESFVKLFALLSIAIFFLWVSPQNLTILNEDIRHTLQSIQQYGVPESFWTQTLLAALAMICLPRQFHVAVVELGNERQLRGVKRWFSLYLILTMMAIIPIASWASHYLGQLNGDIAVLALPIAYQQDWLTVLAFLGGFSASTGMLLVSSLALSIMLTNDLIMPTIWRFNLISRQNPRLPMILKCIRQACILLVMLLGFIFFRLFDNVEQLSILGLLAFSAVAQFAPTLIGGLYWRNGSKHGVMAGLMIGFSLWAYTLLLPTMLRSLPQEWAMSWASNLLNHGIFDLTWLRPEALFGFSSLSPLTHGVLWSLGLNIVAYIGVSKWFRPSVAEQIQAESFFYYETKPILNTHHDDNPHIVQDELHQTAIRLKVGDLFALAQRITGYEPTLQAFNAFCQHNNLEFNQNSTANGMWWRFTEQYLASAIGASSARTLLTTAMVNDGLALGQVANILDQASRWQRFNRNVLMTMLDNMTLGVSVVDENMCLIAWNQHYLQLFEYPESLVYIGCPVADLIRYNAERGECGEGSIEEHINKRLNWMRMGNRHEFERVRKNGKVIQMKGVPIEGGGFVTTFADITAFREHEIILEAKVQERTQQLEIALAEQQRAREQADIANMAKSRFLAAASHDLLQPMHAARLFSTALEYNIQNPNDKKTLEQLDRALHGAESMLSALLDIARLESGTLQPKRQAYALNDLLSDLKLQFSGIAQQRQLKLSVHDTAFWIDTDPQWIRRIVQNFVSNALRYTAQGRIVVGVLRSASQKNHIRIGVWDTGFGISEQQQQKLFQEFERCGHTSPWGEQGLGLGLAIVHRMVQLLDYKLYVYSQVNRGSCFMLEVPLVSAPQPETLKPTIQQTQQHSLKVLCLDNDEAILQGMQILLEKWGHQAIMCNDKQQALTFIEQHQPDVWLIDQHLNQEQMGIDFILQHRVADIPIALVTADSDPDLPQRLKELGIVLMKKPLKPAQLRAWLNSLKVKRATS